MSRPTVELRWSCSLPVDDHWDTPEDRDDGFWPSRNPEDAGWVGDEPGAYERAFKAASERMARWKRGEWWYVGVIAECEVTISRATVTSSWRESFTLRSAGLWGIESDCNDWIAEMYAEQRVELTDTLLRFCSALGAWDVAVVVEEPS